MNNSKEKESELQRERELRHVSLSMQDRNGQRSIHEVSVHVNIYSLTSQYTKRRQPVLMPISSHTDVCHSPSRPIQTAMYALVSNKDEQGFVCKCQAV